MQITILDEKQHQQLLPLCQYQDVNAAPTPSAMRRSDSRDVRWVEGLRGISALFIVTSHTFSKLNTNLESPAPSATAAPGLLQLPVFRLIIAGRASLAFFFLLAGFVNSLNFLREVRSRNHDVALSRLAKSAFRRVGRLVLPATAATAVSWALCQMGAYQLAKRGDVAWFRDISPSMSKSIPWAVWDLFKQIWATWAIMANEYDKVQWNLYFLLKASMIIYIMLLALAFVTTRARRLILGIYYMYSWSAGDSLIGMSISSGILMAELLTDMSIPSSPTRTSFRTNPLTKILPPLVILLGCIVAGYPEKNPNWAPWSYYLNLLGTNIFKAKSEMSRNWASVGSSLILLGCLYSPHAKSALSHPYLVWMGKVSFSVFLIHGFLIKSFLCWMLYWNSEAPTMMNDDGEQYTGWLPHPRGPRLALSLLAFFGVLYPAAWAWYVYVEAACGKAVGWVEDRLLEEEFKTTRPLVPVLNGQARV